MHWDVWKPFAVRVGETPLLDAGRILLKFSSRTMIQPSCSVSPHPPPVSVSHPQTCRPPRPIVGPVLDGIGRVFQEFPALGSGMANLNLGGGDEGYSRQVDILYSSIVSSAVVCVDPLSALLLLQGSE